MTKPNTKAYDDYFNRLVGIRLRRLRHSRYISQRELADLVGVSPQQIQKYESGRDNIRLPRFIQLLTQLNCTLSRFFAPINFDSKKIETRVFTKRPFLLENKQ